MRDRLSPLDALFLYTEDGTTHMHIGSCAIFEGPAPTIDEVSRLIESKLPLITRYRQRIRFIPAGLGHPVWVDDDTFNLEYHVRHSALPTPGEAPELDNLMGRLMSKELDRDRPLWEAWLIEGLSDNRWALISKVHHCMVDGVAGTDLMTVLLDGERSVSRPPAQRWRPTPSPSDAQLLLEAAVQLVAAPTRQLASMWSGVLHPRRSFDRASIVLTGFRSFAEQLLIPAKGTSVQGTIGPNRRWSAARGRLDDVAAIRTAFGGSVNDVVLAAIAGAFRSLLLARGEAVMDDAVLNSLVPVSTRASGDHASNNQVSLIIAELPIGIADPVQRLAAVRSQMNALKSSHQVESVHAVVDAAGLVPPATLALAGRAIMTMMHTRPQRVINTVTTNVPGPQFPLYALGREMLEYLPYVPVSAGVRVGVAILSYNGLVSFGVTGDYDTAPDVQLMAGHIEAELAALGARAKSQQKSRRQKPRRARRGKVVT